MLKEHILAKTHFIPLKHMRKVIEVLEGDVNKFAKKKKPCDNNLFLLQRTRLNTFDYSVFSRMNWLTMFVLSCHKAVYSHDWDKLLYLLRKFPRWKFHMSVKSLIFEVIYTRYLTLLLMYHPSSQAQGLLCEYLHMVWGCRTDQDKKAVLKVLLHLPKNLPRSYFIVKKKEEVQSD